MAFPQGTPQGISYQAVAYDSEGFEISNQDISVRLGILLGGVDAEASYTEVHSVTTDDFGLFSLVISQGETSDTFSSINWEEGAYLKVEVDANLDGEYSIMGVSSFNAVPYALSAPIQSYVDSMISSLQDQVSHISSLQEQPFTPYVNMYESCNEGDTIYKLFSESTTSYDSHLSIDNQGNYIVTTSTGIDSILGSYSPGVSNLRVTKFSSSGEILWNNFISGSQVNIQIDDSDNSVFVLTEANNTSFLHKINSNGYLEWQKSILCEHESSPYCGGFLSSRTFVIHDDYVYIPVKYFSSSTAVYIYDKYSSNFHELIEFDCDLSGTPEVTSIKIDSESNIIIGTRINNYDGYVLKYNQNENTCNSFGIVDTRVDEIDLINDQIVSLWGDHKIITLDSELMIDRVREFKYVDYTVSSNIIYNMLVIDDGILITLNNEYGSVVSEEALFNSYDFDLNRLVSLSQDLSLNDTSINLLIPSSTYNFHIYDLYEFEGQISLLFKVSGPFCFNDVIYDTGTYIIVL